MAARHLRPADAPHYRGGRPPRGADACRTDQPGIAPDRGAAHDLSRGAAPSRLALQGTPMVAKFLPYLKAHRGQVIWALAQVFLIAGFELLKPWPLQIVIDYVLSGKPAPVGGRVGELLSLPSPVLLLVACAGMILVNLAAGALTLLHNYTTIRVGQN